MYAVLHRASWLLILGLSFCLSGCWPGYSQSTAFYLLEPTVHFETSEVPKSVIVLAPIRLAHYLDRSQIVTALGDNRYHVSEFHRWAETLDHNIHRVLQQDLARLLPADVVSQANDETLRLSVTILSFHVDAEGQARLSAQWQLSRNKQTLKLGQGEYRESVSVQDYTFRVAAMNACLAQMTQQLVGEIRALFP